MGLLDKLTGRQARAQIDILERRIAALTDEVKAAQTRYPSWALATADAQRFDLPGPITAESQARLFQQLSWVNAAINTVGKLCALQPFNVLRVAGEKQDDIEGHAFEQLLMRPNPLMARYELLFSTVAWRKLTGNAYWFLNRTGPNVPPSEVWLVPSPMIQPIPDGRSYLAGYRYDPGDGQTITLPVWSVCHFRGFNPTNNWLGASDIEALSWAATSDHAMQRWNANFFAKDNAKFPGMIAFADYIPDPQWEEIKREWTEQSGGVQRSLRMLRNVGAGGVQWVQTHMSQSDMEFLAGRTFTREEMWAVLAPGLASMLAVNANEANALAGRRTLVEMTVWPELVSIAETITNTILPAYGPNLVGAFDDPRMTDRAMQLAERAEWNKTHTVAESREHWDGDDPLGDERDKLLVVEVGIRSAVAPTQEPPAAQQQAGDEQPAEVEDVLDEAAADDDTETVEAKRREELSAWRRVATRRGAEKALGFTCEHLPRDVADVIRVRLADASCPEEVKAAFSGPFLVKAARTTIRGETDPLGDEKDAAEVRLRKLLKSRLSGQFEDVMRTLGDPPNLDNLTTEFWQSQAGLMMADLRPELERMARTAGEALITRGIGVDWTLVAERAAAWAETYTFDAVAGIEATTQRILQRRVAQWFREPTTIGALQRDLEPYFGAARAEAIAVTEITRAAAQGELAAAAEARAAGMQLEAVWNTNQDELVCDVCGANDGKRQSEGWTVDGVPAHVNCRCWITHEWVRA